MPGVVLDTSVIIPAERNHWTVSQLLDQVQVIAGESVVALSPIVVAELAHGIYREKSVMRQQNRLAYLSALTRTLPGIPFTLEIGLVAGRLDA